MLFVFHKSPRKNEFSKLRSKSRVCHAALGDIDELPAETSPIGSLGFLAKPLSAKPASAHKQNMSHYSLLSKSNELAS
jgi:hypothetical protein